jgi:hypothetical protein
MAKSKRKALDTLYFVNESNKTVTLEVITGGVGQTSKMSVYIDDDPVKENHPGMLPTTNLGLNKALQGKILTINCTIADTSRETNFTEMRIRLNGGIIFMEYPLFANVEEEGGSVNYTCLITFFKP